MCHRVSRASVSGGTATFNVMTRLSPADYLVHIESNLARFREVAGACDQRRIVPTCPDWTAADLLWHMTEVTHYWAYMVGGRPEANREGYQDPERPDSLEEVLRLFDEHSAAMIDALRDADPAEYAWTWNSRDQTVGFVLRRQALEALVHRLDAELTADQVTALDPLLAADGVEECLDVMFGGCPPWGTYSPLPHHVRLDLTDVDQQVWVQLGHFDGTDPDGVGHHEDDIRVVEDPGTEPDAVVEGPAPALLAWLWRRGDDSETKVHGDKAMYDHFRLAVNHPIN